MHVGLFGATDREDLIIEACVKAVAYDPQCEDDRTDWLIDMIDTAGIEDFVLPRILGALHDGFAARGFWDKSQLCRLALAYAKRGRTGAREALYSALGKNDSSADVFAAEEIIQLDGSDGFLHVAEKVGEWIADDPETSAGVFLLQFYDETNGEGSAERILRSAADHHPRIAALLEHLNAQIRSDDSESERVQGTQKPELLERFGWNKPGPFEAMRNWTADEIVRDIQQTEPGENTSRLLYMRWGENASDDDLAGVFEALCGERDQPRQRLLLGVFQRRGFLEVDGRALRFADHHDLEIRWSAYCALARHEHPDVRALALARVQAARMSEGELGLLIKNYRAGDWLTIREGLTLTDDPDAMHDLFQDLLDVYEENPDAEAVEPMLLAYEHTPCSNCRHRAVALLRSMDRLPGWIRDECAHDADEETRNPAVTA